MQFAKSSLYTMHSVKLRIDIHLTIHHYRNPLKNKLESVVEQFKLVNVFSEDGNSSYSVKTHKLHFQPKHSIHILTRLIKLLSSECNIGTK